MQAYTHLTTPLTSHRPLAAVALLVWQDLRAIQAAESEGWPVAPPPPETCEYATPWRHYFLGHGGPEGRKRHDSHGHWSIPGASPRDRE